MYLSSKSGCKLTQQVLGTMYLTLPYRQRQVKAQADTRRLKGTNVQMY